MRKYSIKKNWISSFDVIRRKPALLIPFIIIGFCEGIALEIAYFSTRNPLSHILTPIIRKFFGEQFAHYPGNFLALSGLFYYGQIVIYIAAGAALTAATVNIFKNLKENLPVKAKAVFKNVSKAYPSFLGYGIIVIICLTLIGKVDDFVFVKSMRLASRFLPHGILSIAPVLNALLVFLSNLVFQAFIILTVPVIVIKKKRLFKALLHGITLSVRNFPAILGLISLPFLLYYPIIFLKSISAQLISVTFPEIAALITGVGIFVSIFVDCFIIVCATRWLLDKEA